MADKFKMPMQQALIGAMNALRDGTEASDIVILAGNRATGEFKASIWPQDIDRAINTLERGIEDLKIMRLRGFGRSGIVN